MNTHQNLKTNHTPYHSNALSGPFVGKAEVTGKFPDWLKGKLVRSAPAIFDYGDWFANHWFDALGMVYSVDIESDGSVIWKQKVLNGDHAKSVFNNEKIKSATFNTPNQRGFLERIFQPKSRSTDNSNVNVMKIGNELVVLGETRHQLIIDQESLETLGHTKYDDALPEGMSMTAHPMYDSARNQLVDIGTIMGKKTQLILYSHEPDSRTRKQIAKVECDRLPYIHSFGLSHNYAVLLFHPLDLNPMTLLWSKKPYVQHFAWRPQEGTKFVLIDRNTGATQYFHTDAMFIFHAVNTFEQGDEVIMDVLAYENADHVTLQMNVDQMSKRIPNLLAKLTRIRMNKKTGKTKKDLLNDEGFEFSQINYRLNNGQDYRNLWGVAIGNDGGRPSSKILGIDLKTNKTQFYSDGDYVFGEPIFVDKPGSKNEAEGVLLSVGTSPSQNSSKLITLDANNLELLSEAKIGVTIPLGYHGNFIS